MRELKMKTTLHVQQRMSQRGISKQMVECVSHFGKVRGDCYWIDRKLAYQYIQQLQQLLNQTAS